jgi:hypothetical protein
MTIGFALVTTQASAQVAVPKSYVDGEVIHADELNTNLEAIAGTVPPRTCATDQIIKWNGSAWVCADLPSVGTVTVEDGAAYGSPVWVDSNGALLTGRGGDFGTSILWRVNGRLETIGGVNPTDNTYTPNEMRYYSSGDCAPSSFLGITLQGDSMWVEDGVLKTEGPLINSTELVYSILRSESNGGNCDSQPGDSSSHVHEVSDTGVAAPIWTTDSTQMFSDLR